MYSRENRACASLIYFPLYLFISLNVTQRVNTSNSTLFIARCPSFTADQKEEKTRREQPVQKYTREHYSLLWGTSAAKRERPTDRQTICRGGLRMNGLCNPFNWSTAQRHHLRNDGRAQKESAAAAVLPADSLQIWTDADLVLDQTTPTGRCYSLKTINALYNCV
jgi:hypothetical protein